VSRRAAVWVVVALVFAAVGVVALAAITKSYLPLFFVWAIQAPIPWVAAKTSRGHPAN
jgi:hypothetical protein